MEHHTRRLDAARDLRAVAHPVRLAVLELLTTEGPMTATELGERLGETPANCSWHLRTLAEHGFIEEAGGGTGRRRPWRAAHRGMSWDDQGQDGDPVAADVRLAGEALTETLLAHEARRLTESRRRLHDEGVEWRAAAATMQSMLWLTANELAEINAAVQELLTSRLDRFDDPQQRPEGARLCAFVAWGMPAYGPPTRREGAAQAKETGDA